MKQNSFLLSFFLLLSISFFSCTQKLPPHTEYVMGTICTINLFDQGTEELYRELFDRLYTLESVLSANLQNTDISEINNASGVIPVQANPETIELLKEALLFSQKTEGSFDPSIGPLVKAWNIGTDYAAIPSQKELQTALSLIDFHKVIINSQNNTVFLEKKGMKLDLGAIAKGYAADELKKIILSHNIHQAIIDLGGNILTIGKKTSNKDWNIGIRDPQISNGNPILTLPIQDKSVVTSGIYERYFEQEGKKYHHILDIKTGYPVENDLLSVTIITGKSIEADGLSTSVFVLGSEKGKTLLRGFPDTEAIFIFKDKHIEATGELASRIHLLSSEYTLTQ